VAGLVLVLGCTEGGSGGEGVTSPSTTLGDPAGSTAGGGAATSPETSPAELPPTPAANTTEPSMAGTPSEGSLTPGGNDATGGGGGGNGFGPSDGVSGAGFGGDSLVGGSAGRGSAGSDAGGGAAGADDGTVQADAGSAGGGESPSGSDVDAGPASGDVARSEGCGNSPTLTNSPSANQFDYNTLTSGGVERRYVLRLPEEYDPTRAHQLILGFHGASNNAGHVAGNPAFFGLYELSEGSTVFVAPEAVDGLWSDSADVTLVDDILEQVEADLCIDTSRVIVQGFSQGAAMARVLACARPGVFLAAVGHSAGGLPLPNGCEPIPYFGSLGLQESGGGGQLGQTELFAEAAGCTIETFPMAPSGGHLCSDYAGCSERHPVRWCSFDAGHTPLPNDAGQNSSWMPAEVWSFLSQL
jgi:predicted esterase